MWLHFKPKQDGRGKEREKKILIVTINSYPTRNREFQNNSNKIKKIEKHHYGFFQAKNGWERPRKREKKNLSFRSVHTRPGIENSKTIAKKLKKSKNIIMATFQAKMG